MACEVNGPQEPAGAPPEPFGGRVNGKGRVAQSKRLHGQIRKGFGSCPRPPCLARLADAPEGERPARLAIVCQTYASDGEVFKK